MQNPLLWGEIKTKYLKVQINYPTEITLLFWLSGVVVARFCAPISLCLYNTLIRHEIHFFAHQKSTSTIPKNCPQATKPVYHHHLGWYTGLSGACSGRQL